MDPPIVGLNGHWVPREDFDDSITSFGIFVCVTDTCNNKRWQSAHAQKEYGQGCNICAKNILPAYMWVNSKQHDTIRCESCANQIKRCEACIGLQHEADNLAIKRNLIRDKIRKSFVDH